MRFTDIILIAGKTQAMNLLDWRAGERLPTIRHASEGSLRIGREIRQSDGLQAAPTRGNAR